MVHSFSFQCGGSNLTVRRRPEVALLLTDCDSSSPTMAAPKREITSFERSIPDYRRRILVSLVKALFLPPLLSLIVIRLVAGSQLNGFVMMTAILSIPLTISARSYISLWAQDSAARKLGATVIPRVKGKWPGNLDVALRVVKSFEEGYVLQIFADLLHEYHTTTVNTRLFWDDQVFLKYCAFLSTYATRR